MRRLHLWIFIFSCIFIPTLVSAQWYKTGSLAGWKCTFSWSTFINSWETLSPPKEEGAYVFCAREISYFNPFSGMVIAECTGNGCAGQYYINNYPFIYRYDLYKYRNPDGSPNQNVAFANIKKSEVYYYDTTDPYCVSTEFDPLYNGWWTNVELFVRGKCGDLTSGCTNESEYSSYKLVTNGMESFDTTFEDNAGNKSTVMCTLSLSWGESPKIDRITPDVIIEDVTRQPSVTLYDLGKEITANPWYFYADPRELDIYITDPISESYNASWIKNWKAEITFVWDHRWSIPPRWVGCSKSENYPPYITNTLDDKKRVNLRCEALKKIWHYILHIEAYDWAGNETIIERDIFIAPNQEIIPRFVQEWYYQKKDLPWMYVRDDATKIFANATDYYRFIFSLSDKYENPIHTKPITDFKYTGKTLSLDTLWGGGSALEITNTIAPTLGGEGKIGDMIFKSYVGGEINQSFQMSIPWWNADYSNSWSQIVRFWTWLGIFFSPLFYAKWEFWGGDDSVVLWQEQSINLEAYMDFHGSWSEKIYPFIPWVGIGAGTSINFIDGLTPIPDGVFTFSNKKYIKTSRPSSNGYIPLDPMNYTSWDFSAILSSGSIGFTGELLKVTTENLWIKIIPLIQHILNGKALRYALTDVILEGGKLNSIYIFWLQQTDGKEEFVTKNLSIGAITWSILMNEIRSNVWTMTRGRTANDGLDTNGIRYIRGDYTLTAWTPTWETLIVIDGNVTIGGGAFNPNKKNIGIILLNEKNPLKGNIFIKPDVPFLAATIVAEGSIQSVNNAGSLFTVSNRNRTSTLEKQLVIYGNIATKNTIGGAVLGALGAQYLLADGEETTEFVLAMNQDLSFLRMRGKWYDDPNWTQTYNQGRDESVVVVSNTDTIRNPPIVLDRVIR